MPFNFEDYIKNSLPDLDHQHEIVDITEFINSLEFYYFSQIKLKKNSSTLHSINIVLEINCNLELLEMLSHFNTGRWGNNGKNETPIHQCLELLVSKNNIIIDIEEVTILLNDTSIVIKRIYDRSIATQFDEILKLIASNYVFLTRGLTQKPYEIFVPIFEEDSLENIEPSTYAPQNIPKSYSEFWGIYLDKEDEASIYDVKRNTYISGNLEFLTD